MSFNVADDFCRLLVFFPDPRLKFEISRIDRLYILRHPPINIILGKCFLLNSKRQYSEWLSKQALELDSLGSRLSVSFIFWGAGG